MMLLPPVKKERPAVDVWPGGPFCGNLVESESHKGRQFRMLVPPCFKKCWLAGWLAHPTGVTGLTLKNIAFAFADVDFGKRTCAQYRYAAQRSA